MRQCSIITFGFFLSSECAEIAIRSFQEFYDSVTPKHKRKLSLTIIEDSAKFMMVNEFVKGASIEKVTRVISRDDLNSIEAEMTAGSMFIFNDSVKTYKIIPQILSYGLPILCIEMLGKVENLDYTCGRIIPYSSKEGTIDSVTTEMSMLYFDAEALKLLSKGAKYKYKKDLSWGEGSRAPRKVRI